MCRGRDLRQIRQLPIRLALSTQPCQPDAQTFVPAQLRRQFDVHANQGPQQTVDGRVAAGDAVGPRIEDNSSTPRPQRDREAIGQVKEDIAQTAVAADVHPTLPRAVRARGPRQHREAQALTHGGRRCIGVQAGGRRELGQGFGQSEGVGHPEGHRCGRYLFRRTERDRQAQVHHPANVECRCGSKRGLDKIDEQPQVSPVPAAASQIVQIAGHVDGNQTEVPTTPELPTTRPELAHGLILLIILHRRPGLSGSDASARMGAEAVGEAPSA
mmetsp:Transcript_63462/g.206890  ORF Transcript_63462/g.206890 Transcript_63462/m.206890 type:complete len:271 (+) Transcript_63462:818-1630(+)